MKTSPKYKSKDNTNRTRQLYKFTVLLRMFVCSEEILAVIR